ncbi:tyrosine-type recombinase/integrase [Bartonella sp. HY329]|uniref:tyrosine-type recombinase/integrase n=1 Tax=unclassified Bartonella TaxID=2645622 RepID=UPI0021C66385|nr:MULTISPECIES: tyrosine-type recombinase/integrase [unclassified Bartonella]UXM96041.1 tyrosine-type recombinase/integrase [Bartonella sp. HY329]UXN10365.1 tyrosine-type recombinase/integrase [Bartonella sp. HY328]
MFSSQRGLKIESPTDHIQPTFIDGVLPCRSIFSMYEFAIILRTLDDVQVLPTIRLELPLLVLTMIRKNLLRKSTWNEIDFESAVWRIPKERVGTTADRTIYLSQQAFDIMVALKVCAGRSKYLISSRYDAHAPLSRSTFNQAVSSISKRAQKEGYTLASLTVDDLSVSGEVVIKNKVLMKLLPIFALIGREEIKRTAHERISD